VMAKTDKALLSKINVIIRFVLQTSYYRVCQGLWPS
jgi:hypothetical protein